MKKIPLADGDNVVRTTLGQELLFEQYNEIVADTGHVTAAKFEAGRPDLLLLDLGLLDLDDAVVFDELSKMHLATKVIAITAITQKRQRAVALGVEALMEKPLDTPQLLEVIRYYLAESETERDDLLNRSDFEAGGSAMASMMAYTGDIARPRQLNVGPQE
jgi:DNA-binding response OmpR family regulator